MVPEVRYRPIGSKPVMLIRRFDRYWAPAGELSMAIRKHVHPPSIKLACEELFARMVFNIFVSNDDDHLRNHGFIFDHRLRGWVLSPLYDVVPRPGHAYERRLHLEVGDKGKLATLDNALSGFPAFTAARADAVELVRRVWGEVRQWKTTFEACGADAKLLDHVANAFRELGDIASPQLVAEIRKGK